MITLEDAYKELCGRGDKLRTSRPDNGYAAYLWRMVRFHGGIDVTMPCTCFFWLQNQLEEEGVQAKVDSIIDSQGREILDNLDKMVDSLCILFGLSMFGAARAWRNVLTSSV